MRILRDRFLTSGNFEVINQDVLKMDLNKVICENKKEIIKKAKIVANLPYYITTPIIMKLLEEKLDIDTITVMIQKEVADRLTAIPGTKNTGAITYAINYYSIASNVLTVPNTSFIPKPEVESEVIKLEIRKKPPVEVENEEQFFRIIKLAFMQRRKTLVNALSNSEFFESKSQIEDLLKSLNIDSKARGETLTIDQYANISNKVKKC